MSGVNCEGNEVVPYKLAQMMEKYQKTKHAPFYEFYKSMGHDMQDC